jgi:hypothetical protein
MLFSLVVSLLSATGHDFMFLPAKPSPNYYVCRAAPGMTSGYMLRTPQLLAHREFHE